MFCFSLLGVRLAKSENLVCSITFPIDRWRRDGYMLFQDVKANANSLGKNLNIASQVYFLYDNQYVSRT